MNEESIVLGTDMAAPVALNAAGGAISLESVEWGFPKKKPRWIDGTAGAALIDDEMAYDNAEVGAVVRVEPAASFDAARAEHGKVVQMLQEAERRGPDGLPCTYTPAGGTTTWTWYLLLGELDELPITHESGYFALAPQLKIRMTRKPALYAPWVTTITDDFSSNTIGSYTFDTGGGTLAVSGGLLVPSSTAEKVAYYSAVAFDPYDAQVTFKVTTGASVAGAWALGPVLRRLDANNYLTATLEPAGAASTLKVYKRDGGGALTQLATSAGFTVAAATSYWVRARIEGNVVTVELFTAAPTATSTAAQTLSYTLAGADATKFGAGVAGDVGLRTNLVPTDYRYDDLELAPNVWVSSLPLMTGKLYGVPGDLPADVIVKLTDILGQARRFAEVGLEQRYAAEQKAANGGVDPPLLIDSDSLVVSGFSGTQTTRTGAYDPDAAGNNVIRTTLTTATTAVCGTGDQKNIGTFRVKARIWAGSGNVRVRLSYQDGDGPLRANPYAAPTVPLAFARVDLGLITIEPARSGTQRWSGQIEAYTSTGGDPFDIDEIELIPAGESYGKARAAYASSPGPRVAYDDFAGLGTGSVLNGRAAPSGGSWVTSGSATDFAGKAPAGGAATRATASDTGPRYAVLGTTNFTGTEIVAKLTGADGVQSMIGLRWTDANNYLMLSLTPTITGVSYVTPNLSKRVAGVDTSLLPSSLAPVYGSGDITARLTVFPSGLVTVHLEGGVTWDLTVQDAALATGGALATGKPWIGDYNTGVATPTRTYDDVVVSTPAPEPLVINSGRSMELATDHVTRENAAGTIVGAVPSYYGSDFKLPPAGVAGRVSRIAAAVRRQDIEVAVDDGITDLTRMQVSYRSKFLVPR